MGNITKLIAVLGLVWSANTVAAEYETIRDIMVQNCIGCHVEVESKDTIPEDWLQPIGEDGEIRLMNAIGPSPAMMPMPLGADPLGGDEIAKIRAWVEAATAQ